LYIIQGLEIGTFFFLRLTLKIKAFAQKFINKVNKTTKPLFNKTLSEAE